MKSMRFFVIGMMCVLLFSCKDKGSSSANYDVIPLPQKVDVKEGEPFVLNSSTKIIYPQGNENLKRVAGFLSEYLKYTTDLSLSTSDEAITQNVILLQEDLSHSNKEAYSLEVKNDHITIKGASSAGVFYGVQTLRKSISADANGKEILFPQVDIEDYPRFGYRGMMLDVARHFFPIEFVKEYIDILALHNINNFHWHLTDDQGWRIEIKKYPKIIELGSQRKETVIGHNTGKFDGEPYGGFYTQEEAKEIVAYAQERFINVIPEIDLPGHMLGALKAYPNLGCTGGPYEVGTEWGVFDDVLCAGNDETLRFLEDVFGELVEIFPSKYFHIGGDECPKVRWEKCPKCQAKIKALGLKADKEHSAEERLQSYVTAHIEGFLRSKGRQIIGWDEIIEGGLAPNTTVMSWRGMEGGATAAKLRHDVIMSPTSHLYFDYYQTTDTENVPIAFRGYVPLHRVYGFDPIPKGLTEEESKHIIGLQANLWTEYIPSTKQVEYMVMPRIDALSEVQWTMPERKNYDSFISRLLNMVKFYDKKGYNYSKTIFDVNADVQTNTVNGTIDLEFSTVDNAPIYYTLDGTEPTEKSNKYVEELSFSETTTVKAMCVRLNITAPIYSRTFYVNKATMKPIALNQEPARSYAFGGALALVDGVVGNKGGYKDGTWIGFTGGNIEASLDLGKATELSELKFNTYVCTGDWIFGAKGVEIAVSDDGKTYKTIAKKSYAEPTESIEKVEEVALGFDTVNARYIKITIEKTVKLPDWHPGKGKSAYFFIDEIILN